MNSSPATSQSMKTCLEMEKSMPHTCGSSMSGCSPLATCPMKSMPCFCSSTCLPGLRRALAEQPREHHGLKGIQTKERYRKAQDERHGLELEHLDHDDDVHSEEHELGEKRAEHDPLHPGWVPPVHAPDGEPGRQHRHERANHPTDHRAKRVHRASCALY